MLFTRPAGAQVQPSRLAAHPAPEQALGASKRLAVLELKGAEIGSNVLENFADEVRCGAVEGLAGRGVEVMTHENMMVLLKEMGKNDCNEGDCEVETARNIGADFVVSGSVALIDDAFVVILKLHESKGGGLLATDRVEAASRLEVSRELAGHARKLVIHAVEPFTATTLAKSPEAKKGDDFAGSVGFELDYSSLGGSNGVAREGLYAGALRVFLSGCGSKGTPIAIMFDAALGGGPGFVYDVDFLLGPGWWFYRTLGLSVVGGLGLNGVTGGTAPFALTAPVRLQLAVNLGARARVEGRAGVNWLFATSARRKRGSEAVHAFADEMFAGGRILIGRRCVGNSDESAAASDERCTVAYSFGFAYQEMLDTRSLLFTAGVGGAYDPPIE